MFGASEGALQLAPTAFGARAHASTWANIANTFQIDEEFLMNMSQVATFEIPKVPAPFATFLLRIPLALMFFQQGLNKLPVNGAVADAMGVPYIVWWFAAYGEIGSAIGLIVGGAVGIVVTTGILSNLADLLTRFSGITMTCVVTGVIWLALPGSLMDVILKDYLHLSLYVGGLYFALRGNTKYGI